MLNIWLKTIGKNDDRPLTESGVRPIFNYCWAYDNKHILYLQDANGNENAHLYALHVATKTTKDLTPFANVKASIIACDRHFPNEVLVSINKRGSKAF